MCKYKTLNYVIDLGTKVLNSSDPKTVHQYIVNYYIVNSSDPKTVHCKLLYCIIWNRHRWNVSRYSAVDPRS